MVEKCVVIGAGELQDAEKEKIMECLQGGAGSVLLIAADGGMDYCRQMELVPDVCLGDFDSISPEEGEERSGKECRSQTGDVLTIRLPREKDDTDMLVALKYGMGQGCLEFHMFGGCGGRLDHTIANLQCLVFLRRQSCRGYLYFQEGRAFVLKNEAVTFDPQEQGVLSLFAMGERAEGVTIKGLKYELTDAVLTNEFPVGVSNEFTGRNCSVSVKKGELLVILHSA